ncbi:MAG: glycosyl transferase [Rhizobiaceae bacterium]|nr:glycosyl transferase [Rhizobiaceae bacterium]
MNRRILFYVQHLLGIGHLARASRVSAALAASGFDVTMATGGMPVRGFPGPGVRHVELEPIAAASEGFSGLVDRQGNAIDEAFKTRRRDQLLATLSEVDPQIVIIEAFPFGRRQVRFELLPLLEAIAARRGRPLVVTSVRDILQERAKPGRDEETVELLNRHFDLLMVHGDPRFASLEDTFPLASEIRPPIAYTGLVTMPGAEPSPERYDVLVSAGGGAAGSRLVAAATDAATHLPHLRFGLITGPNLPPADYEAARRAAPASLELMRFRTDFTSLLASAELSVSQAGYNTIGDILRAGCRSVLVPFAEGGETEQSARAARLERMGLAETVEEAVLTGERLAAAISGALAKPKPPAAALDLDGTRGSVRVLEAALRTAGRA